MDKNNIKRFLFFDFVVENPIGLTSNETKLNDEHVIEELLHRSIGLNANIGKSEMTLLL